MDMVQTLVTIGKALSCSSRVLLLQLAGEEGMSIGWAVARSGLSQSCVSHHVAVLVRAGLLERVRRGPSHRYRWPEQRLVLALTSSKGTTMTGRPAAS